MTKKKLNLIGIVVSCIILRLMGVVLYITEWMDSLWYSGVAQYDLFYYTNHFVLMGFEDIKGPMVLFEARISSFEAIYISVEARVGKWKGHTVKDLRKTL